MSPWGRQRSCRPPVLFFFPFARPISNRVTLPTPHAHAALHRLQSMWNECRRMTRERGAAMVECSLLIALIAIVALAAIQGFGQMDRSADVDVDQAAPPAAAA